MDMPKTITMDIETCPIIAAVWGLGDQNVGTGQIRRDWAVISWSAKELGAPESAVEYHDLRHYKYFHNYDKPVDDKPILEPMHDLLKQADIVITQNGKSFDGPKLNARFIERGLAPIMTYKHLDTYRIAKGVAKFTSNKLSYLTEKLCTKYKKLEHKLFPGMSLWDQCEKGNLRAWAEMKRYNIHDTLSTEELYTKLRGWAPANMPQPYFVPDGRPNCGVCGKTALTKLKKQITKKGLYQVYQCQNCGACHRGEKLK